MTSCLAGLLMGATAAPAQEPDNAGMPDRPNILLIISDDIGTDVSATIYPGLIDNLLETYGPSGHDHPDYQTIDGRPAVTPTLNQLARQGMAFTSVWAHPFCSPSRAAMLTGVFAASTRVASYADALSQGHTSFVQKLRDEAGYSTAIFGKWHMAGLPGDPVSYPGMKPKEAGFDLLQGNLHAAIGTYWDYDYQVQDESTPADEWRSEPAPERSLPGIAPTTYAPVVKVADTIDWIREQEEENPGQPWFAWTAFNLSHATAQQAPSQMAVPDTDTLTPESLAEMQACGGNFGTQDPGDCSGEQMMRAMTNSMDTVIGKLLEAVDEVDANTYVIYVSDNGTPMYGRPNLDFIDNMYITRSGRGKGTVYESGALVPLVIRGPGIAPGTDSDAFAHVADLFSTILELAGVPVPEQVSDHTGSDSIPLDARSLAPVALGDATSVRDREEDYILTETLDLMRNGVVEVGARNGRYKVLCSEGTGSEQCEFYDLVADPLEEFPLTKPGNCNGYASGDWDRQASRWHYCHLLEAIEADSIL